MELMVLNTDFQVVDILDDYTSLIWADRYQRYGDFEIYAPFSQSLYNKVKQNYYLVNDQTDHIMIVEGLEIDTNSETGAHYRITGRSLESILERRIVWTQTSVSGNLQTAIRKLINESIISPSISARRISNFVFENSTDPRITSLTIDTQYTGDNIYDIISTLCETNDIGFKITLNDNNQFVFKLYSGDDRSYAQNANPYVVFSPSFENIINTNYIDNLEPWKNVTLVAGEDSGQQRVTETVGSASGLTRRELYTDARDIQSEKVADFRTALRQRGLEKLAEVTKMIGFEGQVDAIRMFVYGRDFFMGDIVQIVNEYGIQGSARVTEFIYSNNETGYEQYPTFAAIQEV